jgi:RNA polymerase sigma factor (sigma-70 family)
MSNARCGRRIACHEHMKNGGECQAESISRSDPDERFPFMKSSGIVHFMKLPFLPRMADKTILPEQIPEHSSASIFPAAYSKYIRLWMNIARSADVPEEDAEDVVHSILAGILSDGKREFASLEHARNYVAKSVLNRVREIKAKGNKRLPWDDVPEERLSIKAEDGGMDERGRREALRRVMVLLPRRDFNIIKLRFFAGLTLAEVSELLKIPMSTISSREGVILERIRESMKKLGYGGMGEPF